MKKVLFSIFLFVFIVSIIYLPSNEAQDSTPQDLDLPGGAKTLIILSHDAIKHRTEKPFYESLSAVEGVVFSPDGQTLASKSYDGTILLWDLTSTKKTTIAPK